MPNRFGRAVPVDTYAPHGLLPDGLLPVARPDGAMQETVAKAAGSVADAFGKIADEAARDEGKAAGNRAGLEESFRPNGSLTIRGKAYDEAAIKTYKDQLDARLRTDLQKVYVANKDDPAALQAGFNTIGDEYRAQHVFPEIAGEFNAQLARLRLPYENKALSDLEERQRDARKASLIESITASQTYARQAASADPMGPQTAAIVSGETARLDRLIDESVASQTITAAAAAQIKIKNRDAFTIGAAVAQAESLKSADEVGQYRDNARKQFAAGKFKQLSADGFEDLDSRLQQIQRAKKTEVNAGVTLLQKNVGDFVQRAAEGFPVSEAEWTRYAASPAGATPEGQAVLDEGQKKLQIASLLRNRSVEDGERLLSQMRAELAREGGASTRQAEVVRFAEQFVKEQRSALNTDQLGLAARKQIIPAIAPLDFQGFAASDDPAAAAALATQVRARTAQARAVGSELQRAPQFLRPEEKDRLKEIVDQGGPKALALAGAIVKGGDRDALNILHEISTDAPLLAQAGNILANGGSMAAAKDAFEAARMKALTGKELAGVPPTVASAAVRDTFGAAFTLQGEDAGRIRTTADAIARARLDRRGLDPKSAEAREVYTRALQEAAGATFDNGVQYGGVTDYKHGGYWFASYKVPVPANIRADSFRDVIRAIRDADLRELPVPPEAAYTVRDLTSAVPVAVRGGYRFAMGDPSSPDPKFIRAADGNPFVLPFDRIDQFVARVPGAFRGGR